MITHGIEEAFRWAYAGREHASYGEPGLYPDTPSSVDDRELDDVLVEIDRFGCIHIDPRFCSRSLPQYHIVDHDVTEDDVEQLRSEIADRRQRIAERKAGEIAAAEIRRLKEVWARERSKEELFREAEEDEKRRREDRRRNKREYAKRERAQKALERKRHESLVRAAQAETDRIKAEELAQKRREAEERRRVRDLRREADEELVRVSRELHDIRMEKARLDLIVRQAEEAIPFDKVRLASAKAERMLFVAGHKGAFDRAAHAVVYSDVDVIAHQFRKFEAATARLLAATDDPKSFAEDWNLVARVFASRDDRVKIEKDEDGDVRIRYRI